MLDLQWLPKGTGFVYSVIETDENYEQSRANLFIYSFATQTATQLTEFDNAFAGMLDVSPDSQQIVFERGMELGEFDTEVVDPDLWIINHDGTGAHLLAANGRAPSWSSQALPPPPPAPTATQPPAPTATPGGPPAPTQTPVPQPLSPKLYLPLVTHGN